MFSNPSINKSSEETQEVKSYTYVTKLQSYVRADKFQIFIHAWRIRIIYRYEGGFKYFEPLTTSVLQIFTDLNWINTIIIRT